MNPSREAVPRHAVLAARAAAVLAFALLSTSCAGSAPIRHPSSVTVTRVHDMLIYVGLLTPEGLAKLKQADDGTSRALLIESSGGEVGIGMDFGEWVHGRRLDVVVASECASSCANYVFPAGKRKWILPGAAVAWHGSTELRGAAAEIERMPPERQESIRRCERRFA